MEIVLLNFFTSYFLEFLSSFFFFKQKTEYEWRISDWSSDVCSSDLTAHRGSRRPARGLDPVRADRPRRAYRRCPKCHAALRRNGHRRGRTVLHDQRFHHHASAVARTTARRRRRSAPLLDPPCAAHRATVRGGSAWHCDRRRQRRDGLALALVHRRRDRSEEHTSELQSLMRISYAVFCLKKKKKNHRE